jgi:hypothetical protein
MARRTCGTRCGPATTGYVYAARGTAAVSASPPAALSPWCGSWRGEEVPPAPRGRRARGPGGATGLHGGAQHRHYGDTPCFAEM